MASGPAQVLTDQDPSQPVARTDDYGQAPAPASTHPDGPPPPPMEQQRSNVPPPPASLPAYGLPAQLTIPGGTFVTARMNDTISSNHNQPGDVFTGTLAQPLVVNGIVLAQRGQNIIGRVVEAGKDGRTTKLGLQMTTITIADGSQINVGSQLVTRKTSPNAGRDVGTVAATTTVGAAIGSVADWGRGAAIGAGAGAAAGLIGVLLTPGRPTVVYPEQVLTFRIDAPVVVNLSRAPQAFRYVSPNEYDQPMQTQVARRPPPRPAPYYGGPYAYPAPYPYPYAYPYYGYGYGYPGFGVGVVVRRGRGWWW